MSDGVLVESNVLIDVLTADERWLPWSSAAREAAADASWLAIDPIVCAELCVHFERREELDEALAADQYARVELPWTAAFLGAHAAVAGMRLLTRGATRYRTYLPTLELVAP